MQHRVLPFHVMLHPHVSLHSHPHLQACNTALLLLSCSMVDIAQQAGLASPAAAEEAVLRMIDAGEVSARIR